MEISYQVVNQAKVTPKIWESARETARRMDTGNMRELNRMKFKHAPYALTVYVYEEKHKTEVKKQMMAKYGTLENKEWPTMKDGSKMKFIPLKSRPSPATVEYLTDHLWIQANSKANEITCELKAWDLREPKAYLGGKSLEWILHSKLSNERKSIPLFKHIARKWVEDPRDEKYEVVIQPNIQHEARKYMQKIQNNLVLEFGNEVLQHFNEWKQYEKTKDNWENLDDSDDEVDNMITKAVEKGDEYARVLIEGTETIQKDFNKKMGRKTLSINSKDGSNEESIATANVSIMTGMTSMMGSIKSNAGKVEWREGVKDNEYTKEKSEKKMEKSLKRTLSQFNVKKQDIMNWIKSNVGKYKEFQDETKHEEHKDYKTMRLVIRAIVKERKSAEDDIMSLADIKNLNVEELEEENEESDGKNKEQSSPDEGKVTTPTSTTKTTTNQSTTNTASHHARKESSTQEGNREGGRGA